MKKNLIYFLSAFMLVFAAGCSQDEDVAPMATQNIDTSTSISQDAKKTKGIVQEVTGTIEGVGSFTADFKITKFKTEGDQLLAVGQLSNVVFESGATNVTQGLIQRLIGTITELLVTGASGTCEILDLTLGPLDLNLLGLVVHLDQVNLVITAESGSGNLLGNLLCAVAGLLDGGGLLTDLTGLLNDILGALG